MKETTPKIKKFCRSFPTEDTTSTAPCSVATTIERTRGLLTPQVLAELLAVSTQAIYLWVKQGRIPVVRFGTSIRFDPVTTAEWLRSKAQ